MKQVGNNILYSKSTYFRGHFILGLALCSLRCGDLISRFSNSLNMYLLAKVANSNRSRI